MGLKTRTEAQILFGLEPGQTVVTGEVSKEKPETSQQGRQGQQGPGAGMGGAPGGMRRPG